MEQPILIAGGGIGGLTAALALARKGQRSIVLEQAPQFGEIGAGIQLGPNAFQCLDGLGLGDALKSTAVFIDSQLLKDALDGSTIVNVPLDEPFRKRFGNPYAVVHRADLHAAILEGARASGLVELRAGVRVVGYSQSGETVSAKLSNGETLHGRALIGADGLRSAIRAQLADDGEPIVCGHTTYRSVIPTEQMPQEFRWNSATLWAGPKVHIVHYPLKGGKVFNLVVTRDNGATEAIAGKPVSDSHVLEQFSHVCEDVKTILRRGQDWKAWVLADREPISVWTDGRVALLGDAAHPTLQYFAQGACMAMEDGVCLADMVVSHADMPAALAAYNKARAVRTARIQYGSRLVGEYIYHPSGAKAAMRNAAMSAMTPADYYEELAWIYDGPSRPSADRSSATP
jgi:3-hydroxybenzoate 6-monooxygenase